MEKKWWSMKKALVPLACLVFLIGLSGNVGAIPVTSCNNTLSTPGETYVLSNNISTSGTCLTIGASNIVLDCAGYSITGNGTGYGIYESGESNVTIRNCNIRDYQYGIHLNSSSNSNISSNTITTSCYYGRGIYLNSNSNSNTLSSNTITTSGIHGYGIYLNSNSNSNTLSSNTITTSGYYGRGIYLNSNSNSNTLSSNTITTSGNLGFGIYLYSSSNSNISSNNITTSGNFSHGICLYSSSISSTISGNTIDTGAANAWAIYISASIGNTFTNNTIASYPTTTSFTYSGDVKLKGVSSPPSDPTGYRNISKYVNAANLTANAWLFLNISYSEEDLGAVTESTLKMYRHNTTAWEEVVASGVNALDNYVYTNITGFSVFAPLGSDITPPTINITSPQNKTYEQGTLIVLSYTANEPISWNWYSLDGDTNTGFVNGTDTIRPDVGSHNITIYANDSANNVGNDTEYFTVTAPSPPPPNGGAAGAPIPYPLKLAFNSITSSVMGDIVQQLGLGNKEFYNTSNTTGSIAHELSLAATLITVDKYPDISYLDVTLGKPVKTLSGDIYEISSELVLDRYFHASTLIIARGPIPADSMTSAAYAKSGNMPIILTKSDELPAETLDSIKALKPSKIIIVGGPVAVSSEVEAELAKLATIERIWGQTRIETAIELAKMMKDPEVIVITDAVNPTADAVITAAGYKAPLIYVDSTKAFSLEEVPQPVRDYLIQHKGARIVFGFGVTDSAKSEIIGLIG